MFLRENITYCLTVSFTMTLQLTHKLLLELVSHLSLRTALALPRTCNMFSPTSHDASDAPAARLLTNPSWHQFPKNF